MTLDELTQIFNTAEVTMAGRGGSPLYQYFHISDLERGAGVIEPALIETLVEKLADYKFLEYAPGQIPVFVKKQDQ